MIILIILISDVCLLGDLTLLVKFFRNHIAIAIGHGHNGK